MQAGAKRKVSSTTLRNTVYFLCKSCGKTDQSADLSSSSASSKAEPPPVKRNKLDAVFSGRSATGANARASTQRPETSWPHANSDNDDEDMDLGSPPQTNPSCNRGRRSLSGSKRKSTDPTALEKISESIDFENKAIANKEAQRELHSIERVIDVLNLFDHLDEQAYNIALQYFDKESHRRMFMYLTRDRQISHINFIVRPAD